MFSRSNPFDESVAAATNENLTAENWELILAVTDKLTRATPENARDCIAAIEKRLSNKNPNVQLYAVALAEALVKNCSLPVHREISSRSFTNTLTKLVHDRTVHQKVRTKVLEFIQMCSFEFRADTSLGLMNEIYHSLRAEGIQFPSPQKPKKEFTQSELDKQKEEEELQLALALSLSESENQRLNRSETSVSTNQNSISATKSKADNEDAPPKISRVRALYDFQPTEQGELGFQKGDIIRVLESVYRDWWKGELRGKTGIFPVNYVEKIVDPSPADLLKDASIENEVMSESKNIDRLLEMLSSSDPHMRSSLADNDELQSMYHNALAIRPKLIKLIEKYSLKKDELVALNEKFMQARTIYDGMLSSSVAKYSSATAMKHGYAADSQPYYPDAQQVYGGYTYPSTALYSSAAQPQQQAPSYGYPNQQSASPVATQSQSTSLQHQQQPTTAYYSSDASLYANNPTTQSQQPQQSQGYQSSYYDYNMQQQQQTFQQTPQHQADHASQPYPATTASPIPPAQQSYDYTNSAQQQAISPPQQPEYSAYPTSAPIVTGDNYQQQVNYQTPVQSNNQQPYQTVQSTTSTAYPGHI